MKYALIVFFSLLFIGACSDNNNLLEDDYRLAFVGTYACSIENNGPFPDPDIELEIKIDSTSTNRIVVARDTVPISEEGTFGPDELRPGYYYELRISGNSVFLNSYYVNIPGISLPMEFYCQRK